MKKETFKFIIQLIISILTAIATTLGVTSCMGAQTNVNHISEMKGKPIR